ncbi:UNVERIFIED_CONTAM: hypothetical protein GTU68_026284 [Idotea baltica]|nr:hypothetical protein [Idotea baltica]
MTHVIGDIRDSEKMTQTMLDFDPEIVIHMAAQPLVRLSYREPVETYEVNVMGTIHLLEACRKLKNLKTVVIVTSDKCYDNQEQIWGYREHDAMGGFDPYSNSKGCAELVTSAYRNSFFHPDAYDQHGVVVCSGRAGNVIGGGDWSLDRLIPDAMRSHCTDGGLTIRAPHAIRPWQHVLEPLSGYLCLAESSYDRPQDVAKGWNFGPRDSEALNVRQVLTVLQDNLGGGFTWKEEINPNDLHEATWLKLDCTAALERLDWAPRSSATDAIVMTAEWYRGQDAVARRATVDTQIASMLDTPAG